MLLLAFLFFFTPAGGSATDLNQIRERYYQSVTDEEATRDLYRELSSIPHPTALVLGYQAALEALFAKHVWNPYSKLTWLDKAELSFAKAIRQDPTNVEIRFLRFTYQHYLPGFLKRSPNLDEDRAAIINGLASNVNQPEPDLRKNVIRFLLESGRCSPVELKLLRSLL
ncbi:MAG: hypothetical protein HUU10_09080 [Bacteroidetes bacterium]|nr:hypothetical protein [Bacteroidota bacterium]